MLSWSKSPRGVWTPVLTFGTPGDLSVVYSVQWGEWGRDGQFCTVNFHVATSSFTWTTASGNLNLTGLPFNASGVTNGAWEGQLNWSGITKANFTDICPQILASAPSVIAFRAAGSGQAAGNVVAADVPSAGSVLLRGALRYRVA